MTPGRTLGVSFETRDALRQEFETNLSNGGIFVATEEVLELRAMVTVRVSLAFADAHVMLDGEVVHIVPPELAGAGAKPGVALQLVDGPVALRERFAAILQGDASKAETDEILLVQPPPPDLGKRRAPRKRARIDARIEMGSSSREGRTRDLSRSGALIGVDEEVAVGERVALTLRHPGTGEEMALGGHVVRQVAGDDTGVSAVGIEFDPDENQRDAVERFVDEVQRVEHTKRMGGMVGPIEEIGPHAVLLMFASTSPAGTLYLRRGEEEAVVAFEAGLLRVARLGALEGMPALVELMAWTDGSFEFHARLDAVESREAPLPLEAALHDAMRQLDEARPLTPSRFPLQAKLREGEPADGYDLSKVEAAVLDLAPVGFPVERVLEVIPEPDEEIFRALSYLADAGLIRIES